MIRMIGLDLDGTLLTRDKRVSEQNRLALEEAHRTGAVIVPVTGRPLSGIPRQVADLPFIRYLITSNGAVITDREKGCAIRERCMSKETAASVLRIAEGEAVIREYFAGGAGFHDARTRELLWKKFAGTPILQYLEQSRVLVDDLYGSLMKREGAIENLSVMFASRKERDGAIEKLQKIKGINIILPMPTDIEVTSCEADKGDAMLALAAMLGLRREEIMAMGDGHNDLGLMKDAGLSVAMGNSNPEIIEAADYMTEDNEHDGVALAIRRFVL